MKVFLSIEFFFQVLSVVQSIIGTLFNKGISFSSRMLIMSSTTPSFEFLTVYLYKELLPSCKNAVKNACAHRSIKIF